MKYKYVLFDMDGTLVNTYQGIYNSYKYAFEKMGLPFLGDKLVGKVIGAPLLSVFEDHLGLGKGKALKAVEHYRKYYSETGKTEVTVYDGIEKSLIALKEAGCVLGVATLKREDFALDILKELNLLKYFDVVYGANKTDTLSKSDLLQKCTDAIKMKNFEGILVGDSEYDAEGAQKAGMDFCAVLYGFGFKEDKSLDPNLVSLQVSKPSDIAKAILS